MTKKEIALILKKLRNDAGFTQKDVAKKLGRPQQTLASWETGQSQPDANTLFTLCDIYGVSVDAAFGFSAAPSLSLTPIEADLIKKFRTLDSRGQSSVLVTLEHEYELARGDEDTDTLSGAG